MYLGRSRLGRRSQMRNRTRAEAIREELVEGLRVLVLVHPANCKAPELAQLVRSLGHVNTRLQATLIEFERGAMLYSSVLGVLQAHNRFRLEIEARTGRLEISDEELALMISDADLQQPAARLEEVA